MLLNKIVMVKWNSKNKKYYESKGYIYHKGYMGKEFKVKVEDLTNGSRTLIDIKCDNPNCKSPYLKPIKWQDYKKQVHEDGKYYCRKCAHKLFGIEKYKKTKLKNGKSFEQWGIENNRQDVLDRWDYELNQCKPSEVNYSTHKKYYFKCPKGIHKSELKNIKDFAIGGHESSIECKMCNSFAQWGINNIYPDFLEKYWNYEKNTINPWEISKGSLKKVYIKCQEKDYHGSYLVSCYGFIVNNSRCPYCSGHNGKVHPLDSLGKLLEDKGLLDLWSNKNKNKKSPYEYAINSHQEVYWKCPNDKHEDYYRTIDSSTKYEYRCPECSRERDESILQEKVRLYLESLNNCKYTILHEHKCTIVPKNSKVKGTNNTMPFDNEIKELKLIIEVMGLQHYEESSGFWFNSNFDLHKRQLYDRYKRMYAKSKGYQYIAIPYWTDNTKEEWKKIINNKINNIKFN